MLLRKRRWKHTKDYPVVEVEWVDAAKQDYDGPADEEPLTCVNRTIGYLYEITSDQIKLAQDVTHEDNTIRNVYGIPRSLIRRIRSHAPIGGGPCPPASDR